MDLRQERNGTGTEGGLKRWTSLRRRILIRPQIIVMVYLSRRIVAD